VESEWGGSSDGVWAVDQGHFELAVIGNAFHRLDRDVAARRIHGWLRVGSLP
jgi:hypothetical protein